MSLSADNLLYAIHWAQSELFVCAEAGCGRVGRDSQRCAACGGTAVQPISLALNGQNAPQSRPEARGGADSSPDGLRDVPQGEGREGR